MFQWRSFPFGWLFLPVSLIGQPFSQKTRDHFLPLLTSTDWWSETQVALRHVFEQDSDFKERMFARQIAVMKGQAWNVVETLKTADHGPLELTRRTRVCVWDDLVDIPVAIPLRTPSAEMRRQRHARVDSTEEEEMDISAANGPVKAREDLMHFSPGRDLPNPNRFELSRNPSMTDVGQMYDEPHDLTTVQSEPYGQKQERQDFSNGGALRTPSRPTNDRHSRWGSTSNNRRAFSFGGRNGNASMLYDGDDAEGDLGFAAATVTEKNTRKVIVERLETVQSKNPVFTWC